MNARMLGRIVALATACLMMGAIPASAAPSPLDVPSTLPQKYRSIARAALRSQPRRHVWQSHVDLHASHGYELTVVGAGNVVALAVQRDWDPKATDRFLSFGTATTVYVTRGTVTSRRIKASFGGLGRIAVHFRPSGRPRRHFHLPHRCPARFTGRHGVFLGRLSFTGEKGYVAIRAHRARGWIRRPLHSRCRGRQVALRRARGGDGQAIGRRPGDTLSVLLAGNRSAVASTELAALQIGSISIFLATREESHGRLAKIRYATVLTSDPGAFGHDDALTSATIRPPLPFRGSGLYAADPLGVRTWEGPLSVSFPGDAREPLTGAEFFAKLETGL